METKFKVGDFATCKHMPVGLLKIHFNKTYVVTEVMHGFIKVRRSDGEWIDDWRFEKPKRKPTKVY